VRYSNRYYASTTFRACQNFWLGRDAQKGHVGLEALGLSLDGTSRATSRKLTGDERIGKLRRPRGDRMQTIIAHV
jgi:hypothetical protein